MPDYSDEHLNHLAEHFEEVAVHGGGKRCGVQWTPWMGDFFTSWSPRNGNNNAEGPWDHWVDLALTILQDPMTEITRPEAHEAVVDLPVKDYYAEVDRELTLDELANRMRGEDS